MGSPTVLEWELDLLSFPKSRSSLTLDFMHFLALLMKLTH